jgi:hypothetical protein
MEYLVDGQPIRPLLSPEEVPQLAMVAAINTTRITTANTFFFIARYIFGFAGK